MVWKTIVSYKSTGLECVSLNELCKQWAEDYVSDTILAKSMIAVTRSTKLPYHLLLNLDYKRVVKDKWASY